MSEPKHTPGPWKAKYVNTCISEAENYILVTGDEGEKVFDIEDINVDENNLTLILAAPDMYEALECACDQYCIGYAGDSIVKCEDCIIGNALRKARGETEPVSNPYKLG